MGIGSFASDQGALVWSRGTGGCGAVFGWGTALFGLLWGGGGLVAVARSGGALGALFAVMGGLTFLFGFVMVALRSEVRIDREWAVIRRSVVITVSEVTVPVRGCHAVAAVRNLVATPRAPGAIGARRYAPTVSVGLLGPQGFVALATELEGAETEGSVRSAVAALSAVTGLPAQDLRASPHTLIAELAAWRRKSFVPILVGTMVVALVLGLAVAMVVVMADRGGAR